MTMPRTKCAPGGISLPQTQPSMRDSISRYQAIRALISSSTRAGGRYCAKDRMKRKSERMASGAGAVISAATRALRALGARAYDSLPGQIGRAGGRDREGQRGE